MRSNPGTAKVAIRREKKVSFPGKLYLANPYAVKVDQRTFKIIAGSVMVTLFIKYLAKSASFQTVI